jgi:formate C-acetyltransferase
VRDEYLDFDDVLHRYEHMMDWLAGVYVNAMNIIHYMHDKYAYERLEMALHDYAPIRTMAFGIAGLSVVADSLSAIKYAKVRVSRDENRPRRGLRDRRHVPVFRQQRQSSRPLASWLVSSFMAKLKNTRPTATPCIPSPC